MTQPPFISWLGHGAVNLAPPGLFHDVTGYAFVLDASRRAMQALVDKLLTPATQGKVSYEVPWNSALLSVTDIAQCSSGPEQIGWLPGKEFAIWVRYLKSSRTNCYRAPCFGRPTSSSTMISAWSRDERFGDGTRRSATLLWNQKRNLRALRAAQPSSAISPHKPKAALKSCWLSLAQGQSQPAQQIFLNS